MELGDHLITIMGQEPRVTLAWALRGMETAVGELPDGITQARVRRQFHQLLLAAERADRAPTEVAAIGFPEFFDKWRARRRTRRAHGRSKGDLNGQLKLHGFGGDDLKFGRSPADERV